MTTTPTSKLDVLASIAARLGEFRDTGRIKGSGDNLSNILIENEKTDTFDIVIHMEKRASLTIHVIKVSGEPNLFGVAESVSFFWPHEPGYPTKPSYNAGESLAASLMYSPLTSPQRLCAAAHYLLDGWLADTNPAHMWVKEKKAKHPIKSLTD